MVVVLSELLVLFFFFSLWLNFIPSFPPQVPQGLAPAVTTNARSGAGGVRLGTTAPGRSLVG